MSQYQRAKKVCARKKMHETKSKAHTFISNQNGGFEKYRTYECDICHCWHVATRGKHKQGRKVDA